ncbi:MAG: hypothetical protein JKY48_19625 [Flavobacteriales bacterium]|nr:hypothetical protein [Flavobacteriales bacterium]
MMQEEQLLDSSERQEISKFKETIVSHLKKWPWIALCVFVCVVVSYFYLESKPNQYKVESKVYIKKNQQFSDPNELLIGGRNSFRRSSRIDDEAIIFKSFPLIRSTLKELKFDVTYRKKEGLRTIELYKKSPIILGFDRKLNAQIPLEINIEVSPSSVNDFRLVTSAPFEEESLDGIYKFNQPIQLGSFSFEIRKNSDAETSSMFDDTYFVSFNSIETISYSYRNMLNFEEIEGVSSILTMSMNTSVPEKSIDFINSLIHKYIEQNLDEKNKVAENTVAFIDRQLEIISDSLNNKEANLEDFKSSDQMASLSMEGQMLIEKYSEIETEKAGYEIRQQYYDYLKGSLKNKDGKNLENLIAPSAFGIQDLIINDLVRRLIDLNLSKRKLVQDGNTKSPLIVQIESATDDLTRTLEGSINNLSKANKIVLNTLTKEQKR